MTGGYVVVLGPTGRNFAAGMSGGIAFVYDEDGTFASRCNKDMVGLSALSDPEDITLVKMMINKHINYTGSTYAAQMIKDFDEYAPHFVKVLPKDYERMMTAIKEMEARGLTGEEALLAAFEVNSDGRI